MKILKLTGNALVILCSGISISCAVGTGAIGNEVLSARSLGQGAVGIAAQNNEPTVAYTNPAGLTRLKGTQVSLGSTWENLHGEYDNAAGGKTQMRSIDVAVPNFGFSHSFGDGQVGTGLTIQSPYGLETHWPGDSPLRYVSTNSKLHLLIVSPAVALRILPIVSVGVGADYINVFDTQLEKHVNVNDTNFALGFPTLGSPDANSRLSGTAANWGYHAGVLVEPSQQHAFGLTYHSKVKLHINGSVSLSGLSGATAAAFGGSDYSSSAFTDLFLPQNIQLGYAYKPNDKWMFEADTAWYDWTSVKDLNIRYAETDPVRLAILTNNGQGNPAGEDWRSAWGFNAGANYKWSERLQLRTGFYYLPRIVPESTFNPSINDMSRYGLTVGTGFALTPSVGLDLAYNAVFFHTREITNNVGLSSTGDPAADISGTHKNFANLVTANVTFRFQ